MTATPRYLPRPAAFTRPDEPGDQHPPSAFERYQGHLDRLRVGHRYSSGELRRSADSLSKRLHQCGTVFADRVVLSAANSPTLLCTLVTRIAKVT
jgi:hypothetical protein